MRALLAVLGLLVVACQPLAASSPAVTPSDLPSSSPSPPASPSVEPSSSPLATPSPTAPPADEFRFIRWASGYKVLALEPGGEVWGEQDVHVDMTAAVLDTVVIDGVEWARVQFGSDRPGDWVQHAWTPSVADIDRGGGTHLDPVYEYITPECPAQPTLGDLSGMTAALAVHCFGSQEITVSPIRMRNDGNELDYWVDGTPEWLAIGDGLMAHWLPRYEELGAVPVYLDPAANFRIPERTWLEMTGHLDDPAAKTCEMTSTEPEVRSVRNDVEAALLCRGHFVVTDVRVLSEAEIPIAPGRATPGPRPSRTATLTANEIEAPIGTRISPAYAWTGTEMIVWEGNSWHEDWDQRPEDDGVAYNPATGDWRRIADGPLSPRNAAASVWTGTEMLIWGGQARQQANRGAAYDPASDTWREIAAAPLEPSYWTSSIWTGTEWWIADSRRTNIAVAAYNPEMDSWRLIASPPGDSDHGAQLVWTGSEIFLADSFIGLLSFDTASREWVSEDVNFHGPVIWTGEFLIGHRLENIAIDPLEYDQFFYPVAWDPATRREVEIARPPTSLFEPLSIGSRLAYLNLGTSRGGYLFDSEAAEWFGLEFEDTEPHTIQHREGAATVWTGDRLIIWGGWHGCPGYSPDYDIGYEILVQAGAGGGLPAPAVHGRNSQSAGPALPPTSAELFAC